MPQVEWTEAPASSGGGEIVRLRFASGTDETVRFVGKPQKFHKVFHNKKSVVVADPEKTILKTKWNLPVETKYAANIIHRRDGRLKLVEVPVGVYRRLSEWAQRKKINPGDNNGTDWTIIVRGDGKARKYQLDVESPTPFTTEELEMMKTQGLYKLDKLYAITPEEELEAKLGLGDINAKPADATTEAVVEKDIPF